MMAAGQAAESGAAVLLLEKTTSTGRKLRLTGNGRCNLTNNLPVSEFIEHVHGNGRFLRQALESLGYEDLTQLFERIGLPTVKEPNGRIYPASGRAIDVVNTMTGWLAGLSVVTKADSPVHQIIVEDGAVVGVKTHDGVEKADAVVIATGGASYPETGSSGDGYKLAESVGHSIVPIRPSLVPLETAGDLPHRLKGLSLTNVRLSLLISNRRIASTSGELLFTHSGISGPAVLRISRRVVDAIIEHGNVSLAVDMLPDEQAETLDNRLCDSFQTHGKRQIHNIIGELVPDKMAGVLLQACGVAADTMGSQVTSDQRERLVQALKSFRVEITKPRPLAEAIVTAGGVDTSEIEPRTMSSKIVRGLYFAGEVIDVDGDSGGFNLQIAFSTGYTAGRAAAEFFV